VCPDPKYEEPFSWWGPRWVAPEPRSVATLLRDGTIDVETAAILWSAVVRRRSLAVVAGPSGVGKTTLLTALLDFLPSDTRRVYLRGCFESFAFVADPELDPPRTALLINEISPHLPVYLWGPAVDRVCEVAVRGYTLLATAHASSVPEFVGMLTGGPLRVPAPRVAAFEFVVVLERSHETPSGRRVSGVWRLSPVRDGVEMTDVGATLRHETSGEPLAQNSRGLGAWFPPDEMTARRRSLTDLRDGCRSSLPSDSVRARPSDERAAP
jgi:energy-coupling factor transporter ATP-binding protein EcfA2